MATVLRPVVLAVLLALIGCKKDKPAGDPSSGAGGPGPAATGNAQAPGDEPKPDKKNPEGCNSDFAQPLVADATLTAKCSPYTVNSDLTVDGYTLTIEAGVELRFAASVAFSVGYGAPGKLIIKGTAEKPVTLGSASLKEPGAWRGLTFYEQAKAPVLEGLRLEYGSGGNDAAISVGVGGVTLKNVKVVGAKKTALLLNATEPAVEVSGLDLSEAGGDLDVLVRLDVNSASAIGAGNTLPEKSALMLTGNLTRDVTLSKQGVPWRFVSLTSVDAADGKTAVLSVAPGVTVQFSEEAGLSFGYSGTGSTQLKAVGTKEAPITFTRFGDDLASTPFRGVEFLSAARGPELDFVTFEFGRKDGALLSFNQARGLGRITHCTFRRAGGSAIAVASAKDRFTAFDGNTFEDIGDAALDVPLELANGLGAGNVFGKAPVRLRDTATRDTTLTSIAGTYQVLATVAAEGDNGKPTTLTLEPGVTIAFSEEGTLGIGYGQVAKLVAKGTAQKPITLTSLNGPWNGVVFYGKGTADLDTVTLENVKAENFPISVEAESQGTIKNVTFKKTKHGLKKCGEKVEASGLKADKGVKADEGC